MENFSKTRNLIKLFFFSEILFSHIAIFSLLIIISFFRWMHLIKNRENWHSIYVSNLSKILENEKVG